jgi:hypothetical protein
MVSGSGAQFGQPGGPAEMMSFTAKPAGSGVPTGGSVVMTDW